MDERTDGPVVILIHGTSGGSSQEHGRLWWQEGGAFRDWLEARLAESRAEIEPFHWSGRNSEAERRRWGHSLLARLRDLDDRGRPYHLVGHSHGGSVIWAALRDSMREAGRGPLKGLRSWTTAGTPFLSYGAQLADTLFLIPLAVAALLVVGLGRGLTTAFEVRRALLNRDHLGDVLLLATLWGAAALVVAFCLYRLVMLGLAWLENRRERRAEAAAYAAYSGPRWLRLCAAEDEAVNGLGKVLTIREKVVPRGGLLKLFGGVADGLFWEQVRAIAYGNDLPSHQPVYAGSFPMPQPSDGATAPDDRLSRRLVALANASSVRVADRIRRMLGDYSYGKLVRRELPAEAGPDESDNWTAMLVHCAYFSDLPDGESDGDAGTLAVAVRVADHVREYQAVAAPGGPGGVLPPAPRQPGWRVLRQAYARGTVQGLMVVGLTVLLGLTSVGIQAAQRRVWALTDQAQIDAILRESETHLRVCNEDVANADWCHALLDTYIALESRPRSLPSGAADVLAAVDQHRLDDAYDQLGEDARFTALLSGSDRLGRERLTDLARHFAGRAEALARSTLPGRSSSGQADAATLTALAECAERYQSLGLADQARGLLETVVKEALANLEALNTRKGFVVFGSDFSAGSLQALVKSLTALESLDPGHFDAGPLDKLTAILTAPPSSGPGPIRDRGPTQVPIADLVSLAALLRERGETEKATAIDALIERRAFRQVFHPQEPVPMPPVAGASGSPPTIAPPAPTPKPELDTEAIIAGATALVASNRAELVRRCADALMQTERTTWFPGALGPADGLKLLALADPKVAAEQARALGERLRSEPIVYNPQTQRPDPFRDGAVQRLNSRVALLATVIEAGLTDPLEEALSALVDDMKKLGAGGLSLRAKHGMRVMKDPVVRDELLRDLLKVLARTADSEGFCSLAETSGLAGVGADSPYLAAKLRLLTAHCMLEQGDISGALAIAEQLSNERDRGTWKGVTKKERSDLNRALTVIHGAAGAFLDARTLSEGCDIADRLHARASLLRRYEGGQAERLDPTELPGVGPPGPGPIFDVVED